MSHVCRNWLGCLLACGLVAACDDTTVQTDNSPAVVRERPVGNNHRDRDAGTDDEADAGPVIDREDTEPEDRPTKPPPRTTKPTKKPPRQTKPPASSRDAGTATENPPELPPVAGTAEPAGCRSYTEASGDMCGGYYCGVTSEQVAAETASNARCSDPDYLCHSDLVVVAGSCARRIQSSMLGASTAQLRTAIQDCVYDGGIDRAHVSEDCMACYLTSIECGGQSSTCLFDCLNGNSEACDSCLRDNNCVDPIFACTGLPSPF